MIKLLIFIAGLILAPSLAMSQQTPIEFVLSQTQGAKPTSYESQGVSKPRAHTTRRLGCADNVNLALREMGLRGSGSSRALDFLNWGRSSRPVPGAVAVYKRKGAGNGHTAIVSRVQATGVVCIFNPNRIGWREICGYNKQALSYRVPENRYASN